MDIRLAKLENVKEELDNQGYLPDIKRSLVTVEAAIKEIAQELPGTYTFAEVYEILTKE